MSTKLHYVLSTAMFLFIFSAFGQHPIWKKIPATPEKTALNKFNINPKSAFYFELNSTALTQQMAAAPNRNAKNNSHITSLLIPNLSGDFESFSVYKANVFSESLAKKYPQINSYIGYSASGKRLRMSVSPNGIEAMITAPNSNPVYIQPVQKNTNAYVVYERKETDKLNHFLNCKTVNTLKQKNHTSSITSKSTSNEGGANKQTLSTFRIAISTTGEYTNYFNTVGGDPIANALAAINATLTRVNEVYETDMAITFELVDATNLIFTDPKTDPYSNAEDGTHDDNSNTVDGWNLQLQNTLSTEIGNAAYDIGHLFAISAYGDGNAGCIGCVCNDDDTAINTDVNKGAGYTASATPEGDLFDIDFVSHEIGHQVGATHTFAYETEGTNVNCEPGSGTTIMGYAGLVGLNNVTTHSSPYFHYFSIKQITENIVSKCQTKQSITNSPPIASAGADYHIPKSTPYILKGSATDPDGTDNLTYCWEQIDSGLTDYLNFGPNLSTGSTNRSLPPSNSPNRYIPKLSSVLNGNIEQHNPTLNSDWETVVNVARKLNWALTVRDRNPNNAAGGQNSFDTMEITVEDVAPFTISNPVNWAQGSTQSIIWNVGQTKNATINCQTVNIKLSTDGGTSFPIVIATSTPNDGEFSYTVPNIPDTTNARLLIEAADNIFYDVSDFNFSINKTPDFFITEVYLDPLECRSDIAVFHFDFVTANGFNETTTFSATGLPNGAKASFSPPQLNSNGKVILTISNLEQVINTDYIITVKGTSQTKSKTRDFNLPFYNKICVSTGNTEYQTGVTGVIFNSINNLNNGKPSGYSDYTQLKTDVNRENTYDLSVFVNTDGGYSNKTLVWIDWNQNCSFEDEGELYDLGEGYNVTNGKTSKSPLAITIPKNAVLGTTIMRISTKFKDDGNPSPCELRFDGEVEDYTLNIIPKASIENSGFEALMVYPNPSQGEFYVKLNGALNRAISLVVFDIRGRLIYTISYNNNGDFKELIQLPNLEAGMYFLYVNDSKRKEVKKIIVK